MKCNVIETEKVTESQVQEIKEFLVNHRSRVIPYSEVENLYRSNTIECVGNIIEEKLSEI